MKELEQLILSKSRPVQKEVKQLQKSELDRLIIEAFLGEQQQNLDPVADEILNIFGKEYDAKDEYGSYPVIDAKKDKVTKNRITITNTGNRSFRNRMANKLKLAGFEVSPMDQGQTTGTKYKVKKGEKEFILVLKQGNVASGIYNIGNFAEGILAYALGARADSGQSIDLNSVKDFAKKGFNEAKRSLRTIDGANYEVKLGLDDRTFVALDNQDKWQYATQTIANAISFANSEEFGEFLKQARDANEKIVINADGVSDQKGTKADIWIYYGEGDDRKHFLGKPGGFSLKSRGSKQLKQTGGNIEDIKDVLQQALNYGVTPELEAEYTSNYTEDRDKLFGKDGTFYKMFQNVIKNNTPMDTEKFLDNLSNELPKLATGQDIGLIDLSGKEFKIFDFSKVLDKAADVELDLVFAKPGSDVPYLVVYLTPHATKQRNHLIHFRPRRDGTGIRFYLEKGANLDQFYKWVKQNEPALKKAEEKLP
jgi:hypothetical protein